MLPTHFIAIFILSLFTTTIAISDVNIPWPPEIADKITTDPAALKSTSIDFGHTVTKTPAAVLEPSTTKDIANLVNFAFNSPVPIAVAARGQAHSIRGQAMATDGIVVNMTALACSRNGTGIVVSAGKDYADVGGEQLWIDVLQKTLEYGVSPVSWTDYLYLTVGGTLSNAGISGQAFRHGPQISNVYELDVVTGKGELVTCSKNNNADLFYGVLGGLGQFGIITRARIALAPAPKRVKWIRMLYSDFSAFTRDQEHLISIDGSTQEKSVDYLEGLVLTVGNWRSSFFPPSQVTKISSLIAKYGIIYCLEVVKYYDDGTQYSVDKEVRALVRGLEFVGGFKYTKDASYTEFLNRVRGEEVELRAKGLWEVPHPWLNLFVPKSGILEFDGAVFKDIVLKRNNTVGPLIVYPMYRNKWDDRMSAVTAEEEVFYNVAFLHASGFKGWESFDDENKEILEFCNKSGIRIKEYLPHYLTKQDWANHFGSKWTSFQHTKSQFDPKMILSPGQAIFNNIFN